MSRTSIFGFGDHCFTVKTNPIWEDGEYLSFEFATSPPNFPLAIRYPDVHGASRMNWTFDLMDMSHLLCQLSYWGKYYIAGFYGSPRRVDLLEFHSWCNRSGFNWREPLAMALNFISFYILHAKNIKLSFGRLLPASVTYISCLSKCQWGIG